MKKKPATFPKRLYVVPMDGTPDFEAYVTVDDCDNGCVDSEGKSIGVYELVETKKLRITREFK